jgi:TRAP transporter 4TM/12TM fusion protein
MDNAVSNDANGNRASAATSDEISFVGQRDLKGVAGRLAKAMAVTLPALTIVVAFTGWFDPMTRRSGHLLFAIPLIFLLYPASRIRKGHNVPVWDWVMASIAAASFAWIIVDSERILWRLVYVDPLSTVDIVLGLVAIASALEATRRTLGMTLVWIALAFGAYAFAGPYLPGILAHKGVEGALLLEHLYLVPEGLFNQITGIMATYLLVFLTFGTFLRMAGGDRIFMDLAVGMAGRTTGGPAKAAIVASTLMGSISGSTIANVVTTGTVTIPLMKRTGYKGYEAGAIETAAGTGGAIMPPIMGAGVFIMAEITGIALTTILLYSILPALVYFGSLYAYVHLKAKKRNLVSHSDEAPPPVRETLKRAWPLLLPMLVLVFMLVRGYSAFFAGAVSVIALVFFGYFRAETRLSPRQLIDALEASTRGALLLSATSACAAVILGLISITGLMLKVTSVLVAFSGGSLLLAVMIIAAISAVIGMGMPITATYIIVSALGAAALGELGASLLAAHLIIFWVAQTATITPPVCMTAFVAASIAHAPPMRTGFEAMRVGKALYLIPLLFAFSDLLSPSLPEVLMSATAALGGLVLFTAAFEGYWHVELSGTGRAVAMASSLCFGLSAFAISAAAAGGWLAVAVMGTAALFLLGRTESSSPRATIQAVKDPAR